MRQNHTGVEIEEEEQSPSNDETYVNWVNAEMKDGRE